MAGEGFAATRRGVLLNCSVLALAGALPGLSWAGAAAKPKIGFIGSGRIGSGLAKLWATAGYQVMLSARDLGPVRDLAKSIGPNASVGTPAEAAAFGDVVVVTVPYNALPQVGKDYAAQLKGKIVLDTCNPNRTRDGDMVKDALEKGTGVMDQIYLPGTRLVRAFNAIPFTILAPEAHSTGEKIGIELAADDQGALAVARQLVIDAGFEPVVVGGLDKAKLFDAGTPIYPKALPASQVRQMLGVK